MRGNELRQALAQKQHVFGIAVEGYGQPRWPRFFANIGLDYVFLDSEHTPQNRETIAWAMQAYAANNIAQLLRIPEPSPTQAAMALDAGAHGVIVPYVETIKEIKSLVGAVKYRPLKGQALKHAIESGQFPNHETQTYLDHFNSDTVLVIMIESPTGVSNLPDMLNIGGVDAVLMGPHDLSVSHGVPEQYDHPIFVRAVQQVIATCHAHEVSVGIHFVNGVMERAAEWMGWGCNLICQRSDTLFVARGAQQELHELRALVRGKEPGDLTNELGASGHST